MNARSLNEPGLDGSVLDDGASEARLDPIGTIVRAVEGIRSDLREITEAPITADISRVRALVRQSKDARRLHEAEVIELCRVIEDSIELVQTKHYRRVRDVLELMGVLQDIGVDPELEDGRVEVSCIAVSDTMQLGCLLQQHCPRLSNAIIDDAKYDAVRMVVWWDAARYPVEQEAA